MSAPELRIAQMITRRQLRGAEVFAAQLAEALSRRGHEVALVSLYGPGEPPITAAGVETVDLGGHRRRPLDPGLLGSTAAFLRSWRPHLVQANGSDTLKYSVLARRLAGSGAPLVYRNISIASAWLRGPLHRAVNRWLARRVDRVAAVSPTAARDFVESYRLPDHRVTAIPIGTPVPETVDRTASRRRLVAVLGEDPSGPVLLHAGSFTPEKDHDTLVQAFAEVLGAHPDAILVLVGEGPLRERIAELVLERGLAAQVVLPGATTELSGLLAAADLFVLSSRVEGLPGVLLEAAAAGLPIVSTDVGSVRDAVLDGRTGFVVPSGDAHTLGRALDRLLADPDLRRAQGMAGRAHVQRHFALEGIVDRFEALYHELTERAA